MAEERDLKQKIAVLEERINSLHILSQRIEGLDTLGERVRALDEKVHEIYIVQQEIRAAYITGAMYETRHTVLSDKVVALEKTAAKSSGLAMGTAMVAVLITVAEFLRSVIK